MASGIYHKHNALKFRLLHVGYRVYPKALTAQEFAEKLKVPVTNVRAQMKHYQDLERKYFRRLKPEKGSRSYRYKLTKFGMTILIRYIGRLNKGFDFNLGKFKATNQTPKYEQVKAMKQAEADRRQAELELTGIEQPRKLKPTVEELLKFNYSDLKYYIGITKRGALEMGLKLRVES